MKGVDGFKKIKGIKWYIIADKNGFLLDIMATAVNEHDRKPPGLI